MSKKLNINDTNDVSIMKSYIGDQIYSELIKLFNKISIGYEFEFIFFGRHEKYLSQEKYITLLKIFSKKGTNNKKYKLVEPEDILDITYQPSGDIVFRCQITGSENINYYMKKLSHWKNHIIYKSLINFYEKGEKGISFMKKQKSKENTIDIDNLDLRARLSKEDDLSDEDIEKLKNLDHTDLDKILYRYKQRTSLYVSSDETSDNFVRIDLTYTKMTNNYKTINRSVPNYELEVETGLKKPDASYLDLMLNEIAMLFKIIQQSNYVISNEMTKNVLKFYSDKLILTGKQISLDARQAITLEIQHVPEVLPNKYAVTDKADGERSFAIIYNNRIYLISINLNVRDLGISLDKKLDKYNGTIFDGEYVFLPQKNRHLFLIFDCLFVGNDDIRSNINLFDRLSRADAVIKECFVFNKQTGYIPELNHTIKGDTFDLDKYLDFHENEIKKYMNSLNHDIEIEKQYPLIRRKYFAGCHGAKNWEIFAYTSTIWNTYTENSEINCPYLLDGVIFQPLEQAYVTKDSAKQEYKWKPPNKNSIDFYIQFEKDKDTGKILTVYDNSYDEYVKNKPYRICKLYVGHRSNNEERPILFKENSELYYAYLFTSDGEVRDAEDNIISDNTVVEFYYNNDSQINEKFRWVPLRTRYDKTESVLRFKKKYGNYVTVAEKVWRSITNPILMEDFNDLAKGNNPSKNQYFYDRKMESLRKKIGHDLIISAAKEAAYYQKTTRLATDMRQFHNGWIKSNLIYTFCHPMYQNNKQLSVLDIACGRGGDIMKFYYAMVSFYVGVDVDREGLISKVDGAVSRYNQMKTKKPNFPRMYFIQADAGAEFDYESQNRALKGMTQDNATLFNKFFSSDPKTRTIFDRINCQFAMHYFLKDTVYWNNFKQNLKNYLRHGGYFIATTFDYKRIIELLKDKDKYSVYYTENGKDKLLFELIRKFNVGKSSDIYGTGNAIDVYMAWISQEGRYLTEYLVDQRFITKELLETCDLELVDTDNFGNIFEIDREYLTEFAKYEHNPDTNKFLMNVAKFYTTSEINVGGQIYNSLMRYYVFRKKDSKSQKGGQKYDFSNVNDFYVPEMSGYNNDYSCINSIHHILKNTQIIPKHVGSNELCSDLGINLIKDKHINKKDLQAMASKIIIEHEIENKNNNVVSDTVVDGLNIFVVERNCNDEFEVDLLQKGKKINNNDHSILLMKEGDFYVPVYLVRDDIRNGIFKMNDPFVKYLMNQI